MCATSKDVQKPWIMQETHKASFWLFLPYCTQAILYLAKYVSSAFFRCMSFVLFVVVGLLFVNITKACYLLLYCKLPLEAHTLTSTYGNQF